MNSRRATANTKRSYQTALGSLWMVPGHTGRVLTEHKIATMTIAELRVCRDVAASVRAAERISPDVAIDIAIGEGRPSVRAVETFSRTAKCNDCILDGGG